MAGRSGSGGDDASGVEVMLIKLDFETSQRLQLISCFDTQLCFSRF